MSAHWPRGPMWLTIISLMSGCAAGPDFHLPRAPRAESYLAVGSAAGVPTGGVVHQAVVIGRPPADDWYRAYRNKDLDALVATALRRNPNIQAALASLRAARADRAGAAGRLWPSLDAGGTSGRSRYNGSYFYRPPAVQQGTANRYGLTADLTYDLDFFGGVRRAVELGDADSAYADEATADVYATVVDVVVHTALAIAADRARIASTTVMIDVLTRQVSVLTAQEDAGAIASDAVLSARTQLHAAERTLPVLRQGVEAATDSLAALLGSTPAGFAAALPNLRALTLPGQLPVSLPSVLVERRPDIRMAEYRLRAANAAIGVAAAARLPSLSLSAQYGAQSTMTAGLFSGAAAIWSVAGNLAAPLFHGGSLAAAERAARARRDQAAALYRQAVLNAFAEVATALQALGNDDAAASLARQELKTAAAARTLAERRVAAGATDAV